MQVSSAEGHRLWAPVYDAFPNPLLALESRIVRGLLQKRPMRVIDLACGTGRWASYFARHGSTVYGVDSCEEMLVQASKRPSLHGHLILADAEHLPISVGTADFVVCSFAASYFSNLRGVLQEIVRISSPNACVVISDMHKDAMNIGWSRSFRVNTCRYEMNYVQRSPEEMQIAAVAAGLELTAHYDAFFGEPERAIFENSGKRDAFTELSSIPAVSIDLWRKL